MAHLRNRNLSPVVKARLRLWPVLGILGMRQCGKSTLLRDFIGPSLKAQYCTLDSKLERSRAERMPDAFLELDEKSKLLIIDEIQKVPDLFDALKLSVDRLRRPGRFLISGSTEFSEKTGIRESLTGRIGILHLFPLSLSEIYDQAFSNYFLKFRKLEAKLTLSKWDKKLELGGMPGICFLRTEAERSQAFQLWLETTCYRDLMNVGDGRFKGELAFEIMSTLAKLEDPSAAAVSKELSIDRRVISRHLDALSAIFAVHRIQPHEQGIGKDQYLIADSGLAHFLGADRKTLIRVHLLIEALSSFENAGWGLPRIKYYKARKGSALPFIFQWHHTRTAPTPIACDFIEAEAPNSNHLKRLTAFQARCSEKYRLLLLSAATQSYQEGGIEIHPMRG